MAVTSSNNLKIGMKDTNGSTDILELQKALNAAGNYNLVLDGSFGGKTEAAVRDYQQKNGLKVDGIVGTNTWGALTKASSNSSVNTQQNGTYKYQEFKFDPYTKSEELQGLTDLYTDKMNNGKPVEQDSAWLGKLQETLDKIFNKEDFSYDLNGDALYQQYKDQYTTQGKMAMMDTMGQAAAATGGYGNSYAQSVGQQTYQGYLQQLNDKVPELYQIALNQYNQEYQNLKDQASILDSLVQQDHSKYRESVSDHYDDLRLLADRVSSMSEEEYKLWSDNVGMKYNIHSDTQEALSAEKSDAYDRAMDLLAIGIMPDSALLTTAGISSADAQALVKKVNQQSSASGSGGSGSGNKGYDNEGYSTDIVKQAQKFVGATADGKWGSGSTASAKAKGYNSLAEVVAVMSKPDKSAYADWDAGDWEGYFAQIRQSEGKSAAEEELKYFTSNGLIPNKYVTYGAIGARGGSMGH